jgi:acyl carrier protein
MDMNELQTKVCKILAENLSVPEDTVTPSSRFQEDLDADSLDLVEAVLALEEEFSVTIPEEEMEGVKTVGQAIQMVADKLGVAS